MLILGHAGITLGAAALLAGPLEKSRWPLRTSPVTEADNTGRSWFRRLGRYVDIRLLLIGSLLPDIIDKPLGTILLRDVFGNGRILSHTLLFLLVITLAALWLYRCRRQTWLPVISFGVFMHLVCDQMWLFPETLFWPVYGFAFEKSDVSGWLADVLRNALVDPGVYIPELIGGAILLWFIGELLYRRKVLDFIKHGRVG